MAKSISNGMDLIDSRDVIARIADLESDEDSLEEGEAMDEDDAQELKALRALASQCEGYGDWQYGETLIRDSYFEDYARELAADVGAISGNEQWPLTCIDWEKACDELKQDYMCIGFDGTEYWMRA